MSDDATRRIVLSRRAKFVAAALVASGVAAGEGALADVPPAERDAGDDAGDAGTTAPPTPCLCTCDFVGKR